MDSPARQTAPKKVAVVACTKQKRPTAARAIELYDRSPLFRLSVAAARREGYPVLILSTKYGLVEADQWARRSESDPFAARKVIHLRA
jgi:hypothetical protein